MAAHATPQMCLLPHSQPVAEPAKRCFYPGWLPLLSSLRALLGLSMSLVPLTPCRQGRPLQLCTTSGNIQLSSQAAQSPFAIPERGQSKEGSLGEAAQGGQHETEFWHLELSWVTGASALGQIQIHALSAAGCTHKQKVDDEAGDSIRWEQGIN